jgi:hypothetical protein
MTKVQKNNKSMQKIIKPTSMIVVKSVAIILVNVKITKFKATNKCTRLLASVSCIFNPYICLGK